MSARRPHVTLKVATSLDGYIDDASDSRRVFSSPEDRAAVLKLRAASDAILVGAGTLRADNPKLDTRGVGKNPLKVTLSRSGKLCATSTFFQSSDNKLVYTLAPVSKEVATCSDVVQIPSDVCSISFLLEDLEKRGIKRLLVEGGNIIHEEFLSLAFVDELRVAVAAECLAEEAAPLFLPKGLQMPGDFKLISIQKLGSTAVLRYRGN